MKKRSLVNTVDIENTRIKKMFHSFEPRFRLEMPKITHLNSESSFFEEKKNSRQENTSWLRCSN